MGLFAIFPSADTMGWIGTIGIPGDVMHTKRLIMVFFLASVGGGLQAVRVADVPSPKLVRFAPGTKMVSRDDESIVRQLPSNFLLPTDSAHNGINTLTAQNIQEDHILYHIGATKMALAVIIAYWYYS